MSTGQGNTTTDEVIKRLTSHFDHQNPEMTGEVAFDVYHRLLELPGLPWTDAHGGFGIVAKYRDVIEVEKCPALYSSAQGAMLPMNHEFMAIPVEFDDPVHAEYRKLFIDLLNRRNVQAAEPYIRTRARELLDAMVARGRGDIMTDVAIFLPISVITKLLGFPEKFRDEAPGVFEEFLLKAGTDESRQAGARMNGMLLEEIAALRRKPRDCYVQTLLRATVQGRTLTDEEVVNALFTFVIAGYETTMGVMGSLTVLLGKNPDLQDRLRRDPAQITPAVEETLRLFPTLHSQFRTVTTTTSLHDRELTPGDKLMLLFAAANRDPEVFEEPDKFRLDRTNVRQHVAFGFGSHLCAGNHLARAEIRIFLETLLQHCPPFQLSGEVNFGEFRMGTTLGWDNVPIHFINT